MGDLWLKRRTGRVVSSALPHVTPFGRRTLTMRKSFIEIFQDGVWRPAQGGFRLFASEIVSSSEGLW